MCDSNRIAHRGCIARFGPLRHCCMLSWPLSPENFCEFFLHFAWRFGMKKIAGIFGEFLVVSVSREKKHESPEEIWGKVEAKFGEKFGAENPKIRRLFVLHPFWPNCMQCWVHPWVPFCLLRRHIGFWPPLLTPRFLLLYLFGKGPWPSLAWFWQKQQEAKQTQKKGFFLRGTPKIIGKERKTH